ncbi:uncharacterized protein LOC132296018 [Cornus florida]|uniref:uncharacterized protein LOC132296018 n=1 Tax=Cornus florida TaxID=4283 RepID=UPI00289D87DC|nr:uncharacterized protein LOC132296018 [Cornus florida]
MSTGGFATTVDQQKELMQKMQEEFLYQFETLRQANEASTAQIALLQLPPGDAVAPPPTATFLWSTNLKPMMVGLTRFSLTKFSKSRGREPKRSLQAIILIAYRMNRPSPTVSLRSLRRQVENMITRGELADYLTPKEYVKPWEVNPRKVEGNQVKVIHEIHGRSEDDQETEEMYRSRLKAAHKLRKLSSVNTIASGSISIGFGDEDLSRVQLSHEDLLVISLLVANYMIKRVLVDLGSSANIITKAVLEELKIPSSSIQPTFSPLMGFDGTKVNPLGVIDLSVTAAKKDIERKLCSNRNSSFL